MIKKEKFRNKKEKKIMKKRGLKFAIAVTLGLSLFLTACGDKKTTETLDGDIDVSKYPIQTDTELTYWCQLPTTLTTITDNLGTTPFSQEYIKRTGIKIKFIHPAVGQATQQFNLMVASGTLPDMVHFGWGGYNGGVERAYEDKVLIELNEMMDDCAPNLKAFLNEHPEYDKLVKTDSKRYLYFPTILDGDKLVTTTGPIIRQDLLEKYNLTSPETIDDWTNVLRTFKENGIESPIITTSGGIYHLYAMFDAPYTFYRDKNDKIQFGMVTEEFKNALIGIKAWYDEGLLEKDFITVDSKMVDSKILNGKSAATVTSGGSGLGKYISAAPDDKFNMVGVMWPAPKKGEVSRFNFMAKKHEGYGVGITTSCKYPRLAAKYLDYVYSEEGSIFANFGIEGESYEMVEGYPTYTELISNNPDGKNFSQALSEYTQANNGRAFVQDERYIEQFYSLPQQQIATREWSKGVSRTADETQAPYVTYTGEESETRTELYNEIINYALGMNAKFITGVEPIENFDKYVARINELGLEKVLEIENAAYQRYKNR